MTAQDSSNSGPQHRTHIGRYPVERLLGSGGMADVYLCRQIGMGGFDRLVVIKRIREELREREDVVYMFLDEARIAAQINHPNVVQIYDIEEEGGLPFLVMEYVRGLSFAALEYALRRREQLLPADLVAAIGMQVCAGLHAAHELRDPRGEPLSVVHRDISPQNLMVSVDGVVKVIDFGVARAKNRLTSTMAGQLKGNLAYAAPETLTQKGASALIDRRADLFSLGVVLYELCCGKELFSRETVIGTMSAVLMTKVPPLCSERADAPPALEAALAQALRGEPTQRFQSAAELLRALQAVAIAGGRFVTPPQIAEWLMQTVPDECAGLSRAYLPSSQRVALLRGPVTPTPAPRQQTTTPGTAAVAPTRLLPTLSDLSQRLRDGAVLRRPGLWLLWVLVLLLVGVGAWQLRSGH